MNKTLITVALEASPGDRVSIMRDNQFRRGAVLEVRIAVVPGREPKAIEVRQQLVVEVVVPGYKPRHEVCHPGEVGATTEELLQKLERRAEGGH